MPEKIALTDRGITALPAAAKGTRYDVRDSVVPGFLVRVTDTGSKTFMLYTRFERGARPVRRSIGEVGSIKLAAARDVARDWREEIRRGVDPVARIKAEAAAKAADGVTFGEAVQDYLNERVIGPDPENPLKRTAGETARQLKTDFGAWVKKPLRSITRADVVKFVEDKAKTAKAMARNNFTALRTFFKWAVHQERFMLESSPCTDISLAFVIGPIPTRKRVLTDDELRLLWRVLLRLRYPIGPLYRLLILTALRANEAGSAEREEFSKARGEWIIPAARMKGRNETAREHLVPLTDEVAAIFDSLPRYNAGSHIFTSTNGELPITIGSKIKKEIDARMAFTLRAFFRLRGIEGKPRVAPWVTHDIRRTVRTNLSAFRSISEETREAILAHARPGVKGVYNVYDYADEKREALTLWAQRLQAIISMPFDDLQSFVEKPKAKS